MDPNAFLLFFLSIIFTNGFIRSTVLLMESNQLISFDQVNDSDDCFCAPVRSTIRFLPMD